MDRRAPVFSTHGCRLNAYETEAMREMTASAGLSDLVIVNTCAVTAEAVRKARQEIRKLRRENPTARLIVERLREGAGEEAIRDAVLGAYRTDEATFDKDFGDFLAELRRHHLLQDEPEEA